MMVGEIRAQPSALGAGAEGEAKAPAGSVRVEPGVKRPTRMSTGYGRRFRRCNTLTRVVVFGCLGMALFGYDTGIVSGAMVLVRQDIELDTVQTETVVSITLLFAAASTVLGIWLNSMLGRKPVIMAAALLFAGGSIVISFAQGFVTLVAGRSLLGVAIGLASGTVPMYSAELAPPAMRGMIVTLNDLNIVFGQLTAAMINVCFQHVNGGWRWSMGLAAGPATLMLVGFLFLPESPRWLAMRGRLMDAEAVLQLVHDPDQAAHALQEILAAIQREGGSSGEAAVGCVGPVHRGAAKLVAVWGGKEVRRAAILGIGLMAMNQLAGINTVMYYSTTILVQAGFSRGASIWLAALCCAAQLLGVCVSVASMDSAGRRVTALRSCAGVVITLTVLALSFAHEGVVWDVVKVGALVSYLVAFGSGLSGVPWVMNAEIYPLSLRAAAVGQATVACWMFNWVVGRYFLSVCELLGTGGAFSIFAGISVVGAVWLYIMLPETMGLELEAISALFQDPYPKAWRKQVAAEGASDADVCSSTSEDDGDARRSSPE